MSNSYIVGTGEGSRGQRLKTQQKTIDVEYRSARLRRKSCIESTYLQGHNRNASPSYHTLSDMPVSSLPVYDLPRLRIRITSENHIEGHSMVSLHGLLRGVSPDHCISRFRKRVNAQVSAFLDCAWQNVRDYSRWSLGDHPKSFSWPRYSWYTPITMAARVPSSL